MDPLALTGLDVSLMEGSAEFFGELISDTDAFLAASGWSPGSLGPAR